MSGAYASGSPLGITKPGYGPDLPAVSKVCQSHFRMAVDSAWRLIAEEQRSPPKTSTGSPSCARSGVSAGELAIVGTADGTHLTCCPDASRNFGEPPEVSRVSEISPMAAVKAPRRRSPAAVMRIPQIAVKCSLRECAG